MSLVLIRHSQDSLLKFSWLGLCLVLSLGLSLPLSFADSTQAGDLSNLQLSLTTDKPAYAAGEPVKIIFMLTNLSDQGVQLRFTSSLQFDIVVSRNETEVWRWSNGRMFSMALTTLVLNPQSSESHAAFWAQKDNSGRPVSPGRYEVLALLPLHQPIFSQPVPFTIRSFLLSPRSLGVWPFPPQPISTSLLYSSSHHLNL